MLTRIKIAQYLEPENILLTGITLFRLFKLMSHKNTLKIYMWLIMRIFKLIGS